MFVDKQIPGNARIEFPSCDECNRSSRLYDQIASMIALTSLRELTEAENRHFHKIVAGVRNNTNKAIYEILDGGFGLRQHARRFQRETGLEAFATRLGQTGIMSLRVLTAKLGFAYFYGSTGIVVPNKGAVVTDVVMNSDIYLNRLPERYKWREEFRDVTESAKHTRQIMFRSRILDDHTAGIFQFGLHKNLLCVAMVVMDSSRHPVKDNDPTTFKPGFIRSIQQPANEFRTSLYAAIS